MEIALIMLELVGLVTLIFGVAMFLELLDSMRSHND